MNGFSNIPDIRWDIGVGGVVPLGWDIGVRGVVPLEYCLRPQVLFLFDVERDFCCFYSFVFVDSGDDTEIVAWC